MFVIGIVCINIDSIRILMVTSITMGARCIVIIVILIIQILSFTMIVVLIASIISRIRIPIITITAMSITITIEISMFRVPNRAIGRSLRSLIVLIMFAISITMVTIIYAFDS